jgi:hypothetical protein
VTGRLAMGRAAADMCDMHPEVMIHAALVCDTDDDAATFLSLLVRYRQAVARGEVLPDESPPEWDRRAAR